MVTIKESAPSIPAQSLSLPDRTTLAAFLFFVLVSGGASVAIRFTYAELPPFFSGIETPRKLIKGPVSAQIV